MNTITAYLALICLVTCLVLGIYYYVKYLKKRLSEYIQENQALKSNLEVANNRILQLSQLNAATNTAEAKAHEKKESLGATPDAALVNRANNLF